MYTFFKKINIILLITLALIVVAAGAIKLINKSSLPVSRACSEEAMICPDGSAVSRRGANCEFQKCPEANAVCQTPTSCVDSVAVSTTTLESIKSKSNLITVENIIPGQEIASPFVVRGRARGSWFFEASFPVSLVLENGTELATSIASAKSDWMTSSFVPFEATLKFTVSTTTKAKVIFKKDNPSGLPEHDDQLVFPVVLLAPIVK